MSHQGIQRKSAKHIFAGPEPGVLRHGDPAILRQRATDWLRQRGLILSYRGRVRPERKP